MDKTKEVLQGTLIELQKQANIEAFNNSESTKQKTEFNRYKQDCRKRALEMAHAEVNTLSLRKATTLPTLEVEETNVLDVANKYYYWLISIPNE